MPALKTASWAVNTAAKTTAAVSSRMTAAGNSVMNFKPLSLYDAGILYYPQTAPVRSTVLELSVRGYYNMNNTKAGQVLKGVYGNLVPSPPVLPRSMKEFAAYWITDILKIGF